MRIMDKQYALCVSAIVLLAVGVGVFRYAPVLRQRQALHATIEDNHRTLEEIHTQRGRLEELAGQLEQMRDQAAAFNAKIPADRSFADLWRQIADLMNQYNLTDQLVQPGAAIESDRLGAILLTLSAGGTMQDIFAFFRAIEQWDRLLCLEEVELTNDGGFGGRVKLSAKARLYYQTAQDKG